MKLDNLEYISLHIGKTAGTTFYEFLKEAYGEQNVIRFKKINYKAKNKDFSPFLLEEAEKVKILHGHFLYKEVEEIHKNSNAKLIAWFRDPVERVISRYFFLQDSVNRRDENLQNDKIGMSLVDFSALPSQKNVMSKYIEGSDLNDYFYLGIYEKFNQNVEEFKEKAEIIKNVKLLWENDGSVYKSKFKVSAEERRIIRELNNEDSELYEEVLKIKEIK